MERRGGGVFREGPFFLKRQRDAVGDHFFKIPDSKTGLKEVLNKTTLILIGVEFVIDSPKPLKENLDIRFLPTIVTKYFVILIGLRLEGSVI